MIEQVGLPFKDYPVRILQGHHGPFSHSYISPTLDLTYAVDFKLPFGTPVLAAEEGEIHVIFDECSQHYSGLDPKIGIHQVKTNFVVVSHEEGNWFSLYSHLEKGSVRSLTSRRDRVERGQVIAKTGQSGWVAEAHLHFQVYRDVKICRPRDGIPTFSHESFPIKFAGYNGPLNDRDLRRQAVPDWAEVRGMSESKAEAHMLERWGGIPDAWSSPILRDRITGHDGQAAFEANLNQGQQAYEENLGDAALGIIDRRNLAGQGHPGRKGWLKARRQTD
jgi:hypothetical protein